MKRKPIRRQRPIKGSPRIAIGACVIDEIEDYIREAQRQYGVSRSFVIAVALADFFGVKVERF